MLVKIANDLEMPTIDDAHATKVKHNPMQLRPLLALPVLSAVVVSTGCQRAVERPRAKQNTTQQQPLEPLVRVDKTAKIALIERNLDIRGEPPDRQNSALLKKLPTNLFSPGFTPRLVRTGRNYFAAVAERGSDSSVWLVGKSLKSSQRVTNLKTSNADIELEWRGDTDDLLVTCDYGGRIEVGTVQPNALKFKRLLLLNRVREESSRATWSGKFVLVFYTSGTSNFIECINTSTGTKRVLYSEVYGPGRREFGEVLPSPDGKTVAFTRLVYTAISDEAGGVWILKTHTGKCYQVTSENSSLYTHILKNWVDSRTLLFYRSVGSNWDLHRLTFQRSRK